MDQEMSEEETGIGSERGGVEKRARIPKRLLALMVVVATSSGLISISGCRDRSDIEEATEEIEDEVGDAKKEVQDEIDDHT